MSLHARLWNVRLIRLIWLIDNLWALLKAEF
jgi:hypothetical protein